MVSLLQRACVGLDQNTGPGLGNPVESDTLSMGVGLLATLLSGPQVLKSTGGSLNSVYLTMCALYSHGNRNIKYYTYFLIMH